MVTMQPQQNMGVDVYLVTELATKEQENIDINYFLFNTKQTNIIKLKYFKQFQLNFDIALKNIMCCHGKQPGCYYLVGLMYVFPG